MALDEHPNVFRYEGKLWISELPKEQAQAQLVAQRAWDAATATAQHWWIAIVIGAGAGVAATLALGAALGVPPALYLVALPLGFGAGAVLGAMLNKRLLGRSIVPRTPRPEVVALTAVPYRVARRASAQLSTEELIAACRRGWI